MISMFRLFLKKLVSFRFCLSFQSYLFSFVLAFAFNISTTVRLCKCKFFNIDFINEFGYTKKSHQKFILNNLCGWIWTVISYKIALEKISIWYWLDGALKKFGPIRERSWTVQLGPSIWKGLLDKMIFATLNWKRNLN